MTDSLPKGDAGSSGSSFGGGTCNINSSIVSNGESKSNILQKQMSISKIGSFVSHSNTCTGSKTDEIEVIESGNCQPKHPKVRGML